MNTEIKLLIAGLLMLLVYVAYNLSRPAEDNGIVALEGYPHGVIICGEGMTINDGHYKDVEVKKLIFLAEQTCPKGEK